ncbi:hypothetical protein HU200_014898 [Digitaria exilis]|uniref:protein-serine/threonine phosphatase n=1 Tax=Digitaria exilis TaxID=1010633 RepID=A0A835KJW9_9POAL|nr:hypothetical protein HU200_014898 [Digitaria exilis]
MSSRNDVPPAEAPFSLLWGESPKLYFSARPSTDRRHGGHGVVLGVVATHGPRLLRGVIDLNSEPHDSFVFQTKLDVVVVVERHAHDEFMILGSGGLWSVVAPAQVCSFVRQRLRVTSRITMQGSPDVLANMAVHRGQQGQRQPSTC